MMELATYGLEPLRDDGAFVLYRARLHTDPAPILLLVASRLAAGDAQPTGTRIRPRPASRSAWAVPPLALSSYGGLATLVLQDNGADPLVLIPDQPLPIARALRLGIAIAAALRQAHQCGIIHKDIKPANILVDANDRVRLTGFAIASRQPRERQEPAPPEVLAGTLAYMAPEQTGRMNRAIDTRSDLYSLGVTLYQMLTGTLPFTATDPLAWVHCHIGAHSRFRRSNASPPSRPSSRRS